LIPIRIHAPPAAIRTSRPGAKRFLLLSVEGCGTGAAALAVLSTEAAAGQQQPAEGRAYAFTTQDSPAPEKCRAC
jgi:hypothetical protein